MSSPDFQPEPCPHCGSNAAIKPARSVRYKCHLCGKPRIPADPRLAPMSETTRGLLKDAQRSHVAQIAWRMASVGLGGVSALTAVLGVMLALFANLSWVGNSISLVLTLIPTLLAVLTWSAGQRAGKDRQDRLDHAWQETATRAYRALGNQASPETLAQALGVHFDYAMELLAEAEVQQLLAPPDGPRLRVADATDALPSDANETLTGENVAHVDPARSLATRQNP